MGDLADALATNAEHVTKKRPTHPKGWEPGFEWDGRKGWIVSDPTSGTSPQFEALLTELGFDPATHEIVGPIQVRRWQQRPGDEYLYYHRATISLRAPSENDPDVDSLIAAVRKRRPRSPKTAGAGAGLVVAMGDWQVGKSDGDGVEGTVERLSQIPGLIEQRWRDLRKLGVPLTTLYLCFGGDLQEACSGHYAQQAFRTRLNYRDQRKVIRWAADRIIDTAAGFAPQVSVRAVGGNHGEAREAGKSHTDFADNVDVAVIEDVAYAMSKNPDRYENVSWSIPNDDLTATFTHDGLVVGLAHGHQAGFGSGDPRTKLHNWWKGQMDGQQPIGDADVLVTFHYHHAWMIQRGKRTHFGCPALDGGSDWFKSATGLDSPPGTLSFVVEAGGWHSLEILR